jgi:hypothetical protein
MFQLSASKQRMMLQVLNHALSYLRFHQETNLWTEVVLVSSIVSVINGFSIVHTFIRVPDTTASSRYLEDLLFLTTVSLALNSSAFKSTTEDADMSFISLRFHILFVEQGGFIEPRCQVFLCW